MLYLEFLDVEYVLIDGRKDPSENRRHAKCGGIGLTRVTWSARTRMRRRYLGLRILGDPRKVKGVGYGMIWAESDTRYLRLGKRLGGAKATPNREHRITPVHQVLLVFPSQSLTPGV